MENLNSLSQPDSVTLAEDGEISARVSEAELTVSPRQSLVDEKISITVKGLSPGQPITLTAKLIGDSKEEFESYGHFVADEAGKICVEEHPCLSGTYTGVDPMGLLWEYAAFTRTTKWPKAEQERRHETLLYSPQVI